MSTPSRLGHARWRLTTRFVALALLLLVAVQAAGLLLVHTTLERGARAWLGHELEVGARLWMRLLEQRAQALSAGAAALAADPSFHAAVDRDDLPTVVAALGRHGARAGAIVAAWVDPHGTLRATGADGATAAVDLDRLAVDAAWHGGAWVAVDGRPLQVVRVALPAPRAVGWIVMVSAVDQTLIDDMHRLSGLDVALVGRGAEGPAVLAATLPTAEWTALAGAGSTTDALAIGGHPYAARAVGVGDGATRALLLRPVGAALAPFRALPGQLGALTVGGVLLLALGGIGSARRVTVLLRALVRASERLGRGDHAQPVEGIRRGDEIGELAQALDRARVDIVDHEAELRRLAYSDHLTGLPNRARLRDALRAALATRDPQCSSVAMLQLGLNRFQHINDRYGHAFGDRVLKSVAERLRGHPLREGDRIARLVGDQFGLLLMDTGREAALAAAHQLATAFEQPLQIDEHAVDCSVAIGLALWPAHAGDVDALLSRAELAMFAAKRRTLGVLAYDSALDAAGARTLALLSELQRALVDGQLRLLLQPKVALADTGIVGAEALLYWQHPQRGLLAPIEFIACAEHGGLMRQLTLWLIEEAMRRWESLRLDGAPLRMAVNVAGRGLLDPLLPAALDAALARHGVPAQAFCLEITESAIMDDPLRAQAALQQLAERGFRLSIDDFGTGYSSLGHLGRLPVHELKIGSSFVTALARDARDAAIVRSTIDLAHDLGLGVVADGIENATTWRRLRQWGCDEGQGEYIGMPMPAEELVTWCRQWRLRQRPSSSASSAPQSA